MVADCHKAFKAVKLVLAENRYRQVFALVSVVVLVVNILSMVLVQWLVTGAAPNRVGAFSSPPYITGEWSIVWVSSYYLANLNLPGEIFWVVYVTPQLMALMLAVSLTVGLLASEIVFLSRLSRGSCRLEKSISSAGSVLAVSGAASITSSAIACPSCGFTFFTTLASAAVASATGSALGVSSLAIDVAHYSLAAGLVANLLVLYLVSNKIARAVKG